MNGTQTAGTSTVIGQFRVTVSGFPIGQFQRFKKPSLKTKKTTIKPAGSSVPISQPSGFGEYDDAELSAYQNTDGTIERAIQEWLKQVCNPATGKTTVTPERSKRPVTVEQLNTDGTVVHEWKLSGCFPTEDSEIDFQGQDENAVIRTLKLSVDRSDFVR